MIRIRTLKRLRQDTGRIRWDCTGAYGSSSGQRTPWGALRAYMKLRKRMRSFTHQP